VINLRYHIVSITAVFLALGIGLAFGAAFIDRATVGQLERNLNRIEDDNSRLESENARLQDQHDAVEAIDDELRQNGLTEMVAGKLAGVPVLTLAVRGADENAVDAASAATTAAGARSAGVLWLTERFALDDQSEVDDLAEALGVSSGSADGLRRTVRRQLGTLLARAALPAGGGQVEPDFDIPSTEGAIAPTGIPELLQRLVDAGFLDYEPPAAGVPEAALFEPGAGLRMLAVSGEGAVVPDADLLVPILSQVSSSATTGEPGPVAVAAQRGPAFDAAPADGDDPAAARVAFVGPIRDDDELRARVSTVDDLESYAGLVAAVLALEHGAFGQYGHYGVGEGAQSLLPPPVDAGGTPG